MEGAHAGGCTDMEREEIVKLFNEQPGFSRYDIQRDDPQKAMAVISMGVIEEVKELTASGKGTKDLERIGAPPELSVKEKYFKEKEEKRRAERKMYRHYTNLTRLATKRLLRKHSKEVTKSTLLKELNDCVADCTATIKKLQRSKRISLGCAEALNRLVLKDKWTLKKSKKSKPTVEIIKLLETGGVLQIIE